MAASAIALVVSEVFAASVAAEAIAGVVAVGLFEAGVSAGLALVASEVVIAGVGMVAGQIAGSLVTSAFSGGAGDSNSGIGQASGGSAGGGGTPASVSSAQAQGLLINVTSNVESIPVIYGTRKVGGSIPFIQLSEGATQYLNIIVVAGEGEIQGISNVYLNDVISTDARYSGLVVAELYSGTAGQAASSALTFVTGGKWSPSNVGAGIAYAYLRLKFDPKAFNGLPTITMDVQGKKVYDPRTGLTAFSNNAALCVRDYLTNTQYGRGIAAAQIDDASFIAAANHCDELVAVPSGTQARYTCDGVVDINNTLFDNIKLLLSSCRGSLVYSGGVYKLVIDRLTTPGFAFTEDNIIGDWQIVQPGRRTKFNRVTAGFFNGASNWQPDFGISDSPAYRVLDNALLLESKIDLPFTSDVYRAQQLAGLVLKQSRFGINVRFTAMPTGLRCEVGDVVSITHSTPGWTAKSFRVTQIVILNSDEVEITAYQYDDTVYNLATLTAVTGAPASNLPDVFSQVVLSGLSANSGTGVLTIASDGSIQSRILLTWTGTADTYALNGLVQIEYQITGEPQWSQIQARGDATSVFIAPVTDSAMYTIRARYENSIGVPGPWATITHTVIGKTAPPASPTNVSLTQSLVFWSKVTDLDLAGYQLRYIPGLVSNYGQATPLHTGLITDMPYPLTQRLFGINTIMVSAVDTTGNVGAFASASLDFGQPDASNNVQTYDYAANGFSGAYTNCSVVGGNLVANADPGSDLYVLNDLYGQSDLYGTVFVGMQWVSPTFVPRYGGGIVTLASIIAGANVLVEYQIDGSTLNDAYGLPDAYASVDLYGPNSGNGNWQVWPGAFNAARMQGIIFRVTISGGATQGSISAFAPSLALLDVRQAFGSLSVNSGGTRLTPATGNPARSWVLIKTVQITPIVDGSNAIAGRVLDFSPALGPLAQIVDNTGTPVTGLATIDIGGLADV
jgi:hypothetical protein